MSYLIESIENAKNKSKMSVTLIYAINAFISTFRNTFEMVDDQIGDDS